MSLSTVFNNVVRRSHSQVFSDSSVRQFSTIPLYPDDMKYYLNQTSLSANIISLFRVEFRPLGKNECEVGERSGIQSSSEIRKPTGILFVVIGNRKDGLVKLIVTKLLKGHCGSDGGKHRDV